MPDLSGIVGMRPRAMNIMLPVEPGDSIDVGNSGGSHPNGDETADNDGWATFSGTSAAAPQLAGAAALVKQACQRLTPVQIRDVLRNTARDVTTGPCHPNQNNQATAGPDLATGYGLVDAYRETLSARLRCRAVGPIRPVSPIRPINPIRLVGPIVAGPASGGSEEMERSTKPPETGPDLTEEELDTLDDMVRKGQADPEDI